MLQVVKCMSQSVIRGTNLPYMPPTPIMYLNSLTNFSKYLGDTSIKIQWNFIPDSIALSRSQFLENTLSFNVIFKQPNF